MSKKVLDFVIAIGEGVVKFIYNTGLFVENTVIKLIKFIMFAFVLFIKFTYATGEKVIKYTKRTPWVFFLFYYGAINKRVLHPSSKNI